MKRKYKRSVKRRQDLELSLLRAHTQNFFLILLNQTEIRLYSQFYDWFDTKRTYSFGAKSNRKMVNAIWFRFDLTRLCSCESQPASINSTPGLAFSWHFSYISFSYFTFFGALYQISLLFLLWLPCHFLSCFHRTTTTQMYPRYVCFRHIITINNKIHA